MPQAAAPTCRQTRFERLVFPHLDRLVGFAARLVGNLADGEDAVQEACVRAWQGFDELRDDDWVRPWMFQIVRTTVCDFREREGRRQRLAPMEALTHHELPFAEETGPFEDLVTALSQERVDRLLETLPIEFALAIQLHDLEGFCYREIAEITGVPLGTVMSRIYRGRKVIAGLLATPAGGEDSAEWRRLRTDSTEGKRKA